MDSEIVKFRVKTGLVDGEYDFGRRCYVNSQVIRNAGKVMEFREIRPGYYKSKNSHVTTWAREWLEPIVEIDGAEEI